MSARSFDALLDERHSVTVRGAEIPLRLPSAAVLEARIFPIASKMTGAAREDETSVTNLFRLSRECISACLAEEATEEEAGRLLITSGGIAGELAREAQRLCGISGVQTGDDPPSLRPG